MFLHGAYVYFHRKPKECGRFFCSKDLNGSNSLTTARDHNSLGGDFIYFSCSPLGKWSNLTNIYIYIHIYFYIYTNIFQMGWFHHQHVGFCLVCFVELTNTLELYNSFLCFRFSWHRQVSSWHFAWTSVWMESKFLRQVQPHVVSADSLALFFFTRKHPWIRPPCWKRPFCVLSVELGRLIE